MHAFKRAMFHILLKRLHEPRKFIQVLMGPRQTGKTTLIRQVIDELSFACHYATADEPVLKDAVWLEQQWESARTALSTQRSKKKGLLIFDEIQKVPGWSETVKRLWEEDTAKKRSLHVVLLGSSTLLMQQGLTESLAGRFEIIPVTHWSYAEMREAFGWNLEQYVFYGGYPGAAGLVRDPKRWARYIMDALIETTISRDILQMQRVHKPALLRRLFELGCAYSGQILSYQKMLGQLQDAGNTTTLAHYLNLLEKAGMLAGLPKFSEKKARQRASSPKLLVLNTALMTAPSGVSLKEAKKEPDGWGRIIESCVGASLKNGLMQIHGELFYWLDRNQEVDFVLRRGKELVAIEVKSGGRKARLNGMKAFCESHRVKKKLLVGADGIPLERFLLMPPELWFK